MPAPLGLTTELEAVNEMLEAIGETPVDSLSSTQGDVGVARNILNREIRALCSEGWYWNTDDEVTLSPDGDGKFPIPTNALRVDPTSLAKNVGVRGRFMWDRKNNTAVFTDASLKVNIVRALPFDDLQQAGRDYVAMKAADIFVKRMLGEEGMVSYTQDDLQEARTRLEQDEADNADHNLANAPGMHNMIGRYRDRSHTFGY